MKTYFYRAQQLLQTDMASAWDFFSSAKNLAVITPPEMAFKILSTLNEKEIYSGMRIQYTVKPLLGISLHWETEIVQVDKPNRFTDRQIKGPYRLWEHEHTFIQQDNAVLMLDVVKYALPLGWAGRVVHALIVRKKIEEIFVFRRKILQQLFMP